MFWQASVLSHRHSGEGDWIRHVGEEHSDLDIGDVRGFGEGSIERRGFRSGVRQSRARAGASPIDIAATRNGWWLFLNDFMQIVGPLLI